VLIPLEEAGIWLPIPGDVLILYFGYQIGRATSPWSAALTPLATITAAVLCGALLLYFVMRRFRSAIWRFSRFLHLDEKRLNWMQLWFQRHGPLVIIPGRLVPGLRIPTTVACGTFAVPLPQFVPAVAIAAVLWGIIPPPTATSEPGMKRRWVIAPEA
jgi:membrane protein DedA with SNARE-associated domain